MDGSDPEVYVSSERVKGIPQLYDSPEQNLKLEYKVRETDLNLSHMSSTSFFTSCKKFSQNATTPVGVKLVMRESQSESRSTRDNPDIVVIGVATHMIKSSNDSEEALLEYREGMKDLLPEIQRAVKRDGSKVLFMVQPTVDEEKLHEAR